MARQPAVISSSLCFQFVRQTIHLGGGEAVGELFRTAGADDRRGHGGMRQHPCHCERGHAHSRLLGYTAQAFNRREFLLVPIACLVSGTGIA